MSWRNIFKDTNTWNEKTIVGFIAFVVMIIFAVVDLSVKDLVIHEFIYDSFVLITLGAFGIAEFGKVFSKNKDD
jgi:hypothetical protein